MVRPYTFGDVTAALNRVAPYGWKGFLSARVNSETLHAPLDGLTKGGWRLMRATATSARWLEKPEARHMDVACKLGLRLRSTDGVVTDVYLDSPAGRQASDRGCGSSR